MYMYTKAKINLWGRRPCQRILLKTYFISTTLCLLTERFTLSHIPCDTTERLPSQPRHFAFGDGNEK